MLPPQLSAFSAPLAIARRWICSGSMSDQRPQGKSSGYFVAPDREANNNFLSSERHLTASIPLAYFFYLTFGPLETHLATLTELHGQKPLEGR